MPAKLKVRVLAARDLPIMDRASELTDAFAEVRFSNTVFKTDVFRKSLNPNWNSEWFKFEVDDQELQDEPLQIRVLDHDTYSAHDAIGKIYIDLNPLLAKETTSVISGWFPLYDTMHGIRGELNVIVKVDLFTDFNKFRQSSCGVQIYCTPGVPQGHVIHNMLGFIEELVVNDDPEYQWIDKIRTPRASNEARQRLFSQLSGALQRRIGLKVLELGGNAVIGYRQCFDLEGESGIVVRGIGTAVHMTKSTQLLSPHSSSPVMSRDFPLPEDVEAPNSPTMLTPLTAPVVTSHSPIPGKMPAMPVLVRRSSDSDLSTPPKGSQAGSSGSGSGGGKPSQPRPPFPQQSIEMLEFPFFTIKSFPQGFIGHYGGVVSARSVKLLDRIHNPDEPETRDAWWLELRTEIRSHARAMGCHAVVGYSESTSICDEVIVLSAMGTAAIVNLRLVETVPPPPPVTERSVLSTSLDRQHFDKEKKLHIDVHLASQFTACHLHSINEDGAVTNNCGLCHIPYTESTAPFPINLSACHICRKQKVPDVLFTTVDPPAELPIIGKGALIQARICRQKRDEKSEANAKEISDCLPFMEYDLHSQLLSKLKIKGMNALFGLRVQVTIGEELIIVLATATGALIAGLPTPALPKVSGKGEISSKDKRLVDLQKKLVDCVNRNKEIYELNSTVHECAIATDSAQLTDESEEELSDLDLSAGNKETFLLEVDDADEDIGQLLLENHLPDGFEVCNTQRMPGIANDVCNLQLFTRVWRGHLVNKMSKEFATIVDDFVNSIFFKLRKMQPCVLCNLDFNVKVPDKNEIQLSVTGICVGLGEMNNVASTSSSLNKSSDLKTSVSPHMNDHDDSMMMFHMEGVTESSTSSLQSYVSRSSASLDRTPSSAVRTTLDTSTAQGCQQQRTPKVGRERKHSFHLKPNHKHGVELTPLSYVPGGRIETYFGNINLFFIRESTSIREVKSSDSAIDITGGLNGFIHSFISEVLAIVRAHVVALGGNALVAYKMSECVLLDTPHKNQGQCLVNVFGDVAHVVYDFELQPISADSMSSSSKPNMSPLPLNTKKLSASPKFPPHHGAHVGAVSPRDLSRQIVVKL
ncbi:C2 domain-containing protein 5-like isoform X2 [Tubulanus polymorphus]|uniref:C2 domain-containing protein 5-like isoform X2 n=1 Tax=Tubulanus polymorphus TaxID=672921 RepID=UPI003DA268B5